MQPRVRYYPEFDALGEHGGVCFEGIRALTYDGADYKGMHTKVFAHIGFPDTAKGKVPAVVLVHGGGGHPEDIWIKKWNEKGFAAIAMDATGYFPSEKGQGLYEGFDKGLKRELTESFYEDGYTVGPDNSCMSDMSEKTENQWMYHAVADVLLAFNVLSADEGIDKDNIGICGISWGGVIASIAIGFDDRFRFAVPIYAGGFLGHGLSPLNSLFRGLGDCEWLAEKRFSRVNMPVMWLCWNDDCNNSVNTESLSYLATKDNNPDTCLSIVHGMRHSHNEAYTPGESYWFALNIVNGRSLPEIVTRFCDDKVHYFCSSPIKRVRLFYITEKMSYVLREKHRDKNFYMAQEWNTLELPAGEHTAKIPSDAVGRYIEYTLEDGIILTSFYDEAK